MFACLGRENRDRMRFCAKYLFGNIFVREERVYIYTKYFTEQKTLLETYINIDVAS